MDLIRDKLVAAALLYDTRREHRRGYNRYAIGQYLTRIDEACEMMAAGSTPRAALLDCFNDRLLDCLLVAIGEPKFTLAEKR